LLRGNLRREVAGTGTLKAGIEGGAAQETGGGAEARTDDTETEAEIEEGGVVEVIGEIGIGPGTGDTGIVVGTGATREEEKKREDTGAGQRTEERGTARVGTGSLTTTKEKRQDSQNRLIVD